MKKTYLLSLLAVMTSVLANTVTVSVPLKNKDIYKVIYASAQKFLAYSGDYIGGGLSGELTNPTIIQITKDGSKTKEIIVKYEAFFMTVDYDFGDPVHEEYTTCKSTLKKIDGEYTVENTTTACDFNPRRDIYEEPQGDPCCDNGGPVVDSNWCFDSYEEGAAYCAQYSQYDYDDYWDY
jgi:hypothetical protein